MSHSDKLSKPKKRPWLRILGAGTAILLAGIAGFTYLFLETQWGRTQLLKAANSYLAKESSHSFEAGAITGSLFTTFEVEKLTLIDESGPWLVSESINVTWRPFELLSGVLNLENLEFERLSIERIVQTPSSADDEAESTFAIPSLPIELALGGIKATEVLLDPSILGTPLRLSIQGNATARRDSPLNASLDIADLSSDKGRLRFEVFADPASQRLDLELSLKEDSGGILSQILGEPDLPAFELALDGEGDFSLWQGHLTGGIDSTAEIDANLTLHLGEDAGGSITGNIGFAALLPEEIEAFLGASASFDAKAEWHEDQKSLEITLDEFTTDTVELTAQTAVDKYGALAPLRLEWNVKDLSAIKGTIDPLSIGHLQGNSKITFNNQSITIITKSHISDISVSEVLAKSAELQVEAEILENSPVIEAKGSLFLDGFVSSQEDVDALIGSTPKLGFAGHYDINSQAIEISSLELNAARIEGHTAGEIQLEKLHIDLSGRTTIQQIGQISQLEEIGIGGNAEINYSLIYDTSSITKLDIDGGFPNFSFQEGEYSGLIGTEPKFKVSLEQSNGHYTIPEGILRLAIGEASFKGSVPADFASLEGDFSVAIPSLEPLSNFAGVNLKGSAKITGSLSGPIENPDIRGRISSPWVQIIDTDLKSSILDYEVSGLSDAPRAHLSYTGDTFLGPVEVSSDLSINEEHLKLSNIRTKARESELNGDLNIKISDTLLIGELRGEISDLGKWHDVAPLKLSGPAKFEVVLTAENDQQRADLSFAGERLKIEDIEVEDLTLKGSLLDPLGEFQAEGQLNTGPFTLPGASISSLEVSFNGNHDTGTIQATGSGEALEPLTFDMAAAYDVDGSKTQLVLNYLEAHALEQSVSLKSPLTFKVHPSGWQLSDGELQIGNGLVQIQGSLTDQAVNARLTATDLPLQLIKLFEPDLPFSGEIDASLVLDGPPNAPLAEMTITGSQLAMLDPAAFRSDVVVPEVSVLVNARLVDGQLTLDGELNGFTSRAVALSATLPMQLSLQPVQFDMPSNGELKADLTLEGQVGPIASLFLSEDHQLEGRLDALLSLRGTVGTPRLEGGAKLKEATYENLATGTLLKDLQGEIEASGRKITLVSLSARDGKKGSLQSGGSIDLRESGPIEIDLKSDLTRIFVMRRDDITLAIDGKLKLQGDLDDLTLKGEITTTRVEIIIGSDNAGSIAELEVVEVNLPSGSASSDIPTSSQAAINLDLKIDIPGKAFVRSNIMDTEWSGELYVTGTDKKPDIQGVLKPIRGQILLADRRFRVEDGTISFGGGKPDPLLDLTSVYSKGDFTARIRVTGTASAPEIELTSSPEMPQDEIISHVLFAKPISQLSTGESIELATAAAKLASGVSLSGGLVDNIRKATGLDVLRAGQSESGAPTVSAGKYVADGVYVGVDQGTGAGSTNATVEVEITPNLSLESSVGADSSGHVGLRWQYDY